MGSQHLASSERQAGSLPVHPPLELETSDWLNTPRPLSLSALQGKVVAIEVFQMLCPGCVSHGLPQAARLAHAFSKHDFAVIGLHSVFEHHEAQGTRDALEAFIHEYRIGFPVGIDAHSPGHHLPQTMRKFDLPGTPCLLLFDRQGRERARHFGRIDDLALGAQVMALLMEGEAGSLAIRQGDGAACRADASGCD